MRVSLITLILLALLTACPVLAQRHIKGQLALTPYLGAVDQWPTLTHLKSDQRGYAAGLDLCRYTETETYWKVSYQYDIKYYRQFDQLLSSERHLLSFDYAPVTFHDHRRRFYLAPLVGVGLGLERINQNQLELPQGTILTQPSALVSMQLGLEGELFLTERTALFAGLHERWLPSSNLTQFRTCGLVGLRFSFFKN